MYIHICEKLHHSHVPRLEFLGKARIRRETLPPTSLGEGVRGVARAVSKGIGRGIGRGVWAGVGAGTNLKVSSLLKYLVPSPQI